MSYESPFVIGLIEDFATVVLFLVDSVFFGIPFTVYSLVGCCLVGFVVLSISVEKAK
jgi:drug/metabolite transporter (DMT)-like permease